MGVTEAPSVHRATELVCQFYQQFIYKAFTSKQLSRICTIYLRRSLCRRHLREIALPPFLHYSVCLLYKTFSLSLHISEEPFLKLYQPYAIFLKINDWLYIKFETLNGGTFFPNVSYFFFVSNSGDNIISFFSKMIFSK